MVVYDCGKLVAVIQVKLYLTRGLKEVDREIENLKVIRRFHSDLRALLLIFLGPSERGRTFSRLRELTGNKDWLSFLILKENYQSLAVELHKSLALERISSTSCH